ncbi:MAG TPA: hypothetical protein VN641_22410 [Urbifossiella sp.]|nr:hypothetical protein [Urbifossiella sp.]
MTPPSESRAFPQIALAAAALVGIGLLGFFWWRSQPGEVPVARTDSDDPRLAYTGPFLNVHPDVQEVGSAVCARCHEKIAHAYDHHPMGQSSFPVADRAIGNLADGGRADFDALGSHFRIDRAGKRLTATEARVGANGQPIYETTTDIAVAIGSGAKGQSFLTLQDGFVSQSPVSWFAQKHLWDVSPGFPPQLHAGRPIEAACLFCHVNRVAAAPGTMNRFEEPVFRGGFAIGCERCHGPGGEHVRRHESGTAPPGIDYSIVNPARLEPALREAVCQQCHLSGETRVLRAGRQFADFRPGLPLESVIRVLVRDHRGENRKAVNHVEQMMASKCYSGSQGALGCITCHDPHEKKPLVERVEHYRAACLKCHDCSTPLEARTAGGTANKCVACHMPRFTAGDIVHSASTDHRIMLRIDKSPGKSPRLQKSLPLVFFPARPPDWQSQAEARDFAIGLVHLALQGRVSRSQAARDALPLLERAIAAAPGDAAAWSAKSHASQFLGRNSEALAAAKTVLTLSPDDEAGLAQLAALATVLKQPDLAIQSWRGAVKRNPVDAGYRQNLAVLLAEAGDWPAARMEAEAAMRLDPARSFARTVLAAGDATNGEAKFRIVEELAPANLPDLRRWFKAHAVPRNGP